MTYATSEREIDRALAWCDLHEAVEVGHIDSAKALAKRYDLPIQQVWAPEDDGGEPEAKINTNWPKPSCSQHAGSTD